MRSPRLAVHGIRLGAQALALVLAVIAGPARAKRPDYPASPRHPVADTLHDTIVVDPYRWLEDGKSPEVADWTRRQNAFTRSVLDAYPGRAALRTELDRLYSLPSISSPTVFGSRYFYWRREGMQNQPALFMADGRYDAPRRMILDPNAMSTDGTVAVDWSHSSPDGRYLAYGVSSNGTEASTLHVLDVVRGKDLPDTIPDTRYANVSWDPDGRGFSYTRHPASGAVPPGEEVFHAQIYHHRLGDAASRDPVVQGEEGRPMQEWRATYPSSDFKWLFYDRTLDWSKNDLYVKENGTDQPFRTVAEGLDGRSYADVYKGKVYIRTEVNSPRGRVVVADVTDPGSEHWKEIIPQQPKGVMESMNVIGGKLIIRTTEAAISHLFVYDVSGRREKEIPLPVLGTVSEVNGEPDGREIFFTFASYTFPTSIFRYALASGEMKLVETMDPSFRPDDYATMQVWAISKDGTQVPMFLVHRKGIHPDGTIPVLLTGYGGFAVSEVPDFQPSDFVWLERGGVLAVACLRGGGEFGRQWHEDGRLEKKQNVFDDLYGCAQFLIDDGLTRADRIAVIGGSNGGLLAGAALTQRPDLFGAIVCEAPLLDMLRYQDFLIGRYWVPEYGSSEDAEQFKFLRAYSPYQNVKADVCYPATLFTCAESDTRVDPLHARKMAALVQTSADCDNPILIRIETNAGHGQGKPTAKQIEEKLDIDSFLFERFGM